MDLVEQVEEVSSGFLLILHIHFLILLEKIHQPSFHFWNFLGGLQNKVSNKNKTKLSKELFLLNYLKIFDSCSVPSRGLVVPGSWSISKQNLFAYLFLVDLFVYVLKPRGETLNYDKKSFQHLQPSTQ